MKTTAFIVALTLIVPSVSLAAPTITNVSGTLTHGSTITVSGSEFGTKTHAAPIAWDTFEDGACDVSATVGAWASTEWTCNEGGIGSTDNRHSRSAYHVEKNMYGTWPQGSNAYFTADPASTRWFAQFWFKAAPDFQFADDMETSLGNVKVFRTWPTGSGSNFVSAIHWGSSMISITEGCPGGGYVYDVPEIMSLDDGGWHLLQFQWVASSTSGAADGAYRLWIDGSMIQSYNGLITECSGQSVAKYLFILGLFDSTSNGNDGANHVFYDDLYADNALARVELCPGGAWTGRGKCEIQPSTSWTGNAVAITLNQGAFSNGATASLYVIDSAGAVNATGYPVTIGGTPDTTPPGAPSGLGVQ